MASNLPDINKNAVQSDNSEGAVLSGKDNSEKINNDTDKSVDNSVSENDLNASDIVIPGDVQNIFASVTGTNGFDETLPASTGQMTGEFLTFKIKPPKTDDKPVLTEKPENSFIPETVTEQKDTEEQPESVYESFLFRLSRDKDLSEEQILSKGILLNKGLFKSEEAFTEDDFNDTVNGILKTSKNDKFFEVFKNTSRS